VGVQQRAQAAPLGAVERRGVADARPARQLASGVQLIEDFDVARQLVVAPARPSLPLAALISSIATALQSSRVRPIRVAWARRGLGGAASRRGGRSSARSTCSGRAG